MKEVLSQYTLNQIYDIRLLKDGVETEIKERITVRILYPLLEKEYTVFKIIYVNEDNEITVISSIYVRGKYIQFTTEHFSYYGVFVLKKATNINVDTLDLT